jgi:hypothetical protein
MIFGPSLGFFSQTFFGPGFRKKMLDRAGRKFMALAGLYYITDMFKI